MHNQRPLLLLIGIVAKQHGIAVNFIIIIGRETIVKLKKIDLKIRSHGSCKNISYCV